MTDNDSHSTNDDDPVATDGGESSEARRASSVRDADDGELTATQCSTLRTDGGESSEARRASSVRNTDTETTQAAQAHRETNYLEEEVNLLQPSTPFMRDHLRVVWTGFALWAIIVFVPVTLTAIVPGVMTTAIPVIGFPLHYFLVAIGAPGGALVLSFWYARERDKLDQKYGISHGTPGDASSGTEEATAADGGVDR